MPRIDPLKLLTCLNVLLNDNGGILSEAEVKRLSGLMRKYSKKLVSKCVYIQILKCTQTDLLGEFMGIDGWNLTHLWLSDAIRAMNWPLVQEILELLLSCPVDVQRLKSNTAPKLVKQLCTTGGNECVRILAERLVQQWLNVVKGETQNQAIDGSAAAVAATNTITAQRIGRITSIELSNDQKKTFLLNQRKLSTDSTSSNNQGPIKMIILKDGKNIVSKIENIEIPGKLIAQNNSINEVTEQNESKDSSDSNYTKKSDDDNQSLKGNKSSKSSDRKITESRDSSSKSRHSNKHKSSHKSSSSSSSSRSSKTSTNSSLSKSKSSSSHRSGNTSKDKDVESTSKDKDVEKNRSVDKQRSSSSSSSKSLSKYKDKYDKKERAEKEKAEKAKDQAEKDKLTLTKIQSPNLDKLGKIPKKQKDTNEKPESPQPTSIKIPSKKASMSIEIRKDSEKSKTVKTYKSQFRSHGLTEEAPPPPSRKGLKKPPPVPSGTSIPTVIPTSGLGLPSLKRSSPKHNEISESKDLSPIEKKSKIDLNSIPIEKPGSIKLIPPKPKPAIFESDMFMDALSASAQPKKELRKRKRRPSDSKSIPDVPAKSTPLKFYQDTLEENKDDDQNTEKIKSKSKDNDYESPESPPKKIKGNSEEKDGSDENEKENNSNGEEEFDPIVKKPPGPGCGPDGPPGVLMLNRRRGPKKKLKWRPQEELEEIRFFDLDETERCNVTKTNFSDICQQERCKEREFLKHRKLGAEDLMTEQTQWAALMLIDDVPIHPEGTQSKEKKIQMEREQTTLKALYFSKSMIPDSASEPDFEHIPLQEPTVIPLDDVTGNPDAINDYTKYEWPEPKPMLSESALSANSNNDLLLNNSSNDLQFPGLPTPNQFNPFLPFGGVQASLTPNGPQPPIMNIPPNMLSNNGPPMGFNLPPGGGMIGNNMMPNSMPFAGNNFGPQGNNNFGPPAMMNAGNNFAPMVMPNMTGPRGMMINRPNGMGNIGIPMVGMNNLGNNMISGMGGWRPGNMPNNTGGGNWRPMNGPSNNMNNNNNNNNNNSSNNNNNNSNNRNWVHGNQRASCKQYLRGNCRNGSRCNYYHPPKSRI